MHALCGRMHRQFVTYLYDKDRSCKAEKKREEETTYQRPQKDGALHTIAIGDGYVR